MAKEELILLAIGDSQIQMLFERALAAGAYKVAVATDNEHIDRLLQEISPTLIILDQHFMHMDGLAIAGTLLDRFPTLPILLFSEIETTDTLKKALRIGVSNCLFAPLKLDDITRAVDDSIRRANHLGDWNRREMRRTTASLQQRVDELQKYDTILNHIEDGVIIMDDKQNILLINPAARRVFGIWTDDVVVGKNVLEIITHPEVHALVHGLNKKGLPHQEITFDDGRVLATQYTLIPKVGAALTMQDITYLKQIDRLKTEFVNTVSHDLRSPLTAILGYVDLLERVGPINEQQAEFIRRVQTSVQSITTLVDDLLELGRIEAGMDTQKEMVPLDGVIRLALDSFYTLIIEKRLDVRTNFAEGLRPLRGNPIRLRQMVDNLLGNAIKYTPEGGEIKIEMEMQNNQVILRVADSGPGIPPVDQPHIFEKFYRASNVPKGIGGSGLGLAIVKSIVESLQGRIWVESVLGQGSTFTVVLPVGV